MARDYSGLPKHHQLESKRRRLIWILGSSISLDFDSHHHVEIKNFGGSQKIRPCDMSYGEYTPCQDLVRAKKFDPNMLK
ncbi:hypothetical protein L1049_022897 [Liquidambar formosana]|uniref:Uncharacterized protein n=1 Tax=Liquidambar formosana TaxID=63359 RepID=A0AAP0REN3_LIQFO